MNYSESSKQALRVFLENMVAGGFLAKEHGIDVTPKSIVDTTFDQIIKIAEGSIPLANIMDKSDLIMHAEGPGAAHGMPWLSAINWMFSTAENGIKRLSSSFFDLSGADGKKLARNLDLRLPGIAPGSIWIGVKIEPPEFDMLPQDEELMGSLTSQIHKLPKIIRFIDDEGMRPGLQEIITDPALLDVQLETLYRLSPTGKRGIHTLEISSRESGGASLSQRERVVLKNTIDKPSLKSTKDGSFIGLMQEADLDKSRLHLKGVPGIGTLRCIMPTLTASHARAMFGGLVKAEGRYQSDKEGRPRLLMVEKISPVEEQQTITL